MRPAAGSWSASSRSPPMRCACRNGSAMIGKLSGGEKRRVALCQLLLSAPDMLLLDEPTNHLDAESVAWLERYLEEYPSTVVAVTHDRYFLDNVAEWILELDRGHGIPWQGNYSIVAGAEGRAPEAGRALSRKACARCSRRNSSGCARIPRRARPRARRACSVSRNSPRRNSRSATRPTRSTFRRANASAIW